MASPRPAPPALMPVRAVVTQTGPVRVRLLSSNYDSPAWWAPAGLAVGHEVLVQNLEGGLAVVSPPRDPNATK